MVAVSEAVALGVGAAVVLTEAALILALRAATREIRTTRADVLRALALLGIGNLVVANMVRRPEAPAPAPRGR